MPNDLEIIGKIYLQEKLAIKTSLQEKILPSKDIWENFQLQSWGGGKRNPKTWKWFTDFSTGN